MDRESPETPAEEILVRPPGCDIDGFAEMMSEIVAQIVIPTESTVNSSPHSGGHKRSASAEAESPRPTTVPKADGVEELFCEVDKNKGSWSASYLSSKEATKGITSEE